MSASVDFRWQVQDQVKAAHGGALLVTSFVLLMGLLMKVASVVAVTNASALPTS
jgi:hypothetical protein